MFNEIAESYDASTPKLPSQYIALIGETFNLGESDHILDLGCGSGLLTFPLAQISKRVQGLDSSLELLRLAKKRDPNGRIEWIFAQIEDFNFANTGYKLIVAFESFHLFPQKPNIIQRISQALLRGGYFCIGWCDYHWEQLFKDTIVQTFSEHSVTWGPWGYQSVPELESFARSTNALGFFSKKSVLVHNHSSHIDDIAKYLVSIEKSSCLSGPERSEVHQKLSSRFRHLTNQDVICGTSIYSIMYARRT